MRPLIQEIPTAHTPESLVENLRSEKGVVLLRTSAFDSPQARYSFVAARPFLTFRSFGSQCEITFPGSQPSTPINSDESRAGREQALNPQLQFGNPWQILDALLARCELLDEIDLPFPLGGCFGCWGYDLKNFVEPKLPRRAVNDLELPDCHAGFYDSLVVFDHHLGKTFVVSTGLAADGSRSKKRAGSGWSFGNHCWRSKPKVGRAVLCAPLNKHLPASGAHGVTRPTFNQISPGPIFLPRSNARSVTSAPATFIR